MSVVLLENKYRWTIFNISPDSSQRSLILSAMADFHARTCIRFVERTTQSNYIEIVTNDSG